MTSAICSINRFISIRDGQETCFINAKTIYAIELDIHM